MTQPFCYQGWYRLKRRQVRKGQSVGACSFVIGYQTQTQTQIAKARKRWEDIPTWMTEDTDNMEQTEVPGPEIKVRT